MRSAAVTILLLALLPRASAESLVATTPGVFSELIFPDAVMRSFSGAFADPLVVASSGAIGSGITGGTIQPGSVLDVRFESAVSNVAVLFAPAVTQSATCEVESIDVAGGVRTHGAFFTTTPLLMNLVATNIGEPVRVLRLRAVSGAMHLLRIDYTPRTLVPGTRLVLPSLGPGKFRELFVHGCEGRRLELVPESASPLGGIEISVGPVDDPLGAETKTVIAKPGKPRRFDLYRPVLYRVRIFNADPGLFGAATIATSETFAKTYAKRKFLLEPQANLSEAEFRFGALPDTTLDFAVTPIAGDPNPHQFDLFETPIALSVAALGDFSVPTAEGAAFAAVPTRIGGALRFRSKSLGGPLQTFEVVVRRTAPLPGVGDLVLQ